MSDRWRISDLVKGYGGRMVLNHFTLELPAQGVVALLGQSGCGKTTLLRLMAGLERPDSGELERPGGSKISMVFQEDRLLEVLTARENLQAVVTQERHALVEECLARCGLGDAADLYPREMSGGMKRRLAIARAVVFGGDQLLLDEPFRGLDPETKRQMMELVFRREGLGNPPALTLLVTHDVDEALAVADTILVMEGIPLQVRKRLENSARDRDDAHQQALRETIFTLFAGPA